MLNYKSLPPCIAASLVMGLRSGSRIITHFSRIKVSFEQLALAQIIDGINILIWQQTKNGHKGRKRPKSLYDKLTERKAENDYEQFETAEDFEAWRQRKLKNG